MEYRKKCDTIILGERIEFDSSDAILEGKCSLCSVSNENKQLHVELVYFFVT